MAKPIPRSDATLEVLDRGRVSKERAVYKDAIHHLLDSHRLGYEPLPRLGLSLVETMSPERQATELHLVAHRLLSYGRKPMPWAETQVQIACVPWLWLAVASDSESWTDDLHGTLFLADDVSADLGIISSVPPVEDSDDDRGVNWHGLFAAYAERTRKRCLQVTAALSDAATVALWSKPPDLTVCIQQLKKLVARPGDRS